MAVNAQTIETYDNMLIREDLQEAYSMISPEEVPLQEMAGTRTVTQPHFEWPTLELQAPKDNNRVPEGDEDVATDDATLGLRWSNYTQISDEVVSVSHTSQSSDAAAENVHRIMEQVSIKIRELKRSMELMLLMNIAANAGSSGVAKVTAGLQAWLSTNVIDGGGTDPEYSNTTHGYPDAAATAGTPVDLSEDALNDVIEACWTEGATPSVIMCNGGNKRVISATFTGNSTRYKDAIDRKLVAAIDIYDSDFGRLTVMPNRFLPALDRPTNTSYSVLVLDPEYLTIAFLDNVQRKPLAETGHAMRSLVWTEYGLQVDNEKAHGIIRDTTNTYTPPPVEPEDP